MSNHKDEGAYVRLAHWSEIPLLSEILTRAYARDPLMNWCGSVQELVPKYASKVPSAAQAMNRLRYFQDFLTRGAFLAGGFATIVVKPADQGEKIVAVALWLKPGQTWELGGWNLLRAGLLRNLLSGWGWTGLYRVTNIITPCIEAVLNEDFESRNLDRLDSWHLLELATEPAEQGNGYCSMLMKEGLSRTSTKPVHLEATTAESRDMCLRYGFEIIEEVRFGGGQVDETGIRPVIGEAADGYPQWVMTKW